MIYLVTIDFYKEYSNIIMIGITPKGFKEQKLLLVQANNEKEAKKKAIKRIKEICELKKEKMKLHFYRIGTEPMVL